MKNYNVFFAFGKAVESKESTPVKRYVGIAPVRVLAVNPTKKELEAIYGTTLDKEPEYLGSREVDGKNVPFVRVDFIVSTDESKSGVAMTTKASFFVRKQFMMNRDATKVKVVDKYARTAWVTQDEFKNKLVPTYKNGPARIDNDYRMLYQGEEELLIFVKNYLGIADVDEFVDGTWRMKAKPEDYTAGFNDMEKWFKGDISEIKSAIAMMPDNYIKLLFGVRTTDEGKEYQDVFTRASQRFNTRKNAVIEKALTEAQNAGAYASTCFETCELKEYAPQPTNVAETVANDDDLPFGDDSNPWA